MTDIAHHLKPILKLVKTYLVTDNPNPAMLHAQLRDLLPVSYGIGSGRITNGEQQSAPIPILIYDEPLANGCYTSDSHEFQLKHVLLTLDVLPIPTWEELREVLAHHASVKALCSPPEVSKKTKQRPLGQQGEVVPKYRLPLSVIVVDRLQDTTSEIEFFARLWRELDKFSLFQQPDYLIFNYPATRLYNPWLTGIEPAPYAIGLQRLPKLRSPRLCYVCKEKFLDRHFFYEQMCMNCGDMSYRKRHASTDLSGRIALVTGGRVKIGYATALRLLRQGAHVIVTSRFPHDTARRYAEEPDFKEWADHLDIYGLDLRFTPNVEAFCEFLYHTYPHLDVLVNNAAQTIQRPPAFYAHLLPLERTPLPQLPTSLQHLLMPKTGNGSRNGLVRVAHDLLDIEPHPATAEFPQGQLDSFGQQVDLRAFNSWVMTLEQVPMAEMVEVHLVNAIAPAILAGQLKGLMAKSPHPQRFILNVSAMEGIFAGNKERGNHPHTNMSKAALNMLTYSIAADYENVGILTYSIDPGWISDQYPASDVEQRQNTINLPLDLEDAAARICDPMIMALQGKPLRVGQLLKDYQLSAW